MRLNAYIQILRPRQWLKNLMLLFPPFLGGTLLRASTTSRIILPLAAFCLASSATYVFNDIIDCKNDAEHPVKCRRPLPAGTISKISASIFGIALLLVSVLLGYSVSSTFLLLLASYLAVSLFYSLKLKHEPIVDIFCISAGFLFRLEAGGQAFGVVVSDWLFLSVFLLSLFLSAGKRLGEMNHLGDSAAVHRPSLEGYPDGLLEGLMYMTGAAFLVTYTMYIIGHSALIYTVPLCSFVLFRYAFRVKKGEGGGDPTDALLRDPLLFILSFAWTLMIGWGIYGRG